jgi:hypothetical protein
MGDGYHIVENPLKLSQVYIGSTLRDAVACAEARAPGVTTILRMPHDYEGNSVKVRELIFAGMDDDEDFTRIAKANDAERDKIEKRAGESGFFVKGVVHLAPDAKVFLDERYNRRFREFVIGMYRMHRPYDPNNRVDLNSLRLPGGLFAINPALERSGINRLAAVVQGGTAKGANLAFKNKKFYVPGKLILGDGRLPGGVVAAGERLLRDEITPERTEEWGEWKIPEQGQISGLQRLKRMFGLRRIFG